MKRAYKERGGVGLLCVACAVGLCLGASSAAQENQADLSGQRRAMEQLEHRLKLLEEALPQSRSTRAGPARNVRANRKALREIILPPQPTKEQVREYIQSINAVGQAQRGYFPDDPYEKMFRRIRAKNLDVLLEALGSLKGVVYWSGVNICNELAREPHKALVLRQLPNHSALIQAVTRNGWEADAKPIIAEALRGNESFINADWIDVIAAFKDPETVPDLRRYLRTGANPYSTHEAIQEFAGDLTEDVAAAWQRVQADRAKGEYFNMNTATLAMTYGHRDALEAAMETLAPERDSYHDGLVRDRVRACVEATGSDARILKWFNENKDKLVFDKESRKWRVPEEAP